MPDPSTASFKQQAHSLIDQLPDSASWNDLAYEMDVRASIERGLTDSKAGRVIAVEDLMKILGILTFAVLGWVTSIDPSRSFGGPKYQRWVSDCSHPSARRLFANNLA